MPKFKVRVMGTITVNIWQDVIVDAEDEDEAIDIAPEHTENTCWKNDLVPNRVTIKDQTSVDWGSSEIVDGEE